MAVNPSPQILVSHSHHGTQGSDPLFARLKTDVADAATCAMPVHALAPGIDCLRPRAERALEAHAR